MYYLLPGRLLAELPGALVEVGAYAAAQIVDGNRRITADRPDVRRRPGGSAKGRAVGRHFVAGIVATAGLVALIFSDTFAGIAPGSEAPFTLAQLAGLVLGVLLILALYSNTSNKADDVVVPHS